MNYFGVCNFELLRCDKGQGNLGYFLANAGGARGLACFSFRQNCFNFSGCETSCGDVGILITSPRMSLQSIISIGNTCMSNH